MIALPAVIDETRSLGWVPLLVDCARSVEETDSIEYGTGAFLMAGIEIIKFSLVALSTEDISEFQNL